MDKEDSEVNDQMAKYLNKKKNLSTKDNGHKKNNIDIGGKIDNKVNKVVNQVKEVVNQRPDGSTYADPKDSKNDKKQANVAPLSSNENNASNTP